MITHFVPNARNEVCKQYGKSISAVVSSGFHLQMTLSNHARGCLVKNHGHHGFGAI
jgi:hypothetical protein